MIMDHLDQSNKPVNRVNAVKSTFLQKHRYDILNLYVCLGWIFFFFSPVSTLCLCSVEVSVTGQENITYHTCVCRHNHEWRRSWLPGFDLTKTSPAVLLRPGGLVGFVITAQPSSFNVNAIRSIWYKCQPWTYLWFRETLTANIISRRLGWNTTVRFLFLH